MTKSLQTTLKRIANSIDTSSISATMQPTVKKMRDQIIDSVGPETFTITNAMSKQLIDSIDFTLIHKKVVDGHELEYEEVFDASDEEKEELIEATFAANPALVERVNSELALTTLSNEQKNIFKWLAVLFFLFGATFASVAINANDDLSTVHDTVSTVGDFSSLALFTKKASSKNKPETERPNSSDDNG